MTLTLNDLTAHCWSRWETVRGESYWIWIGDWSLNIGEMFSGKFKFMYGCLNGLNGLTMVREARFIFEDGSIAKLLCKYFIFDCFIYFIPSQHLY